MVSGDRDELVKDMAFVLLGGTPVALSQRGQSFLLCHLAYASTHAAASEFWVAFYLRQPLSLGNDLGEAMRNEQVTGFEPHPHRLYMFDHRVGLTE